MKIRMFLSVGLSGCEHSHEVDVEDLGYTEEEWRNLTEEEKSQESVDYWNGLGIPDIGYEEMVTE